MICRAFAAAVILSQWFVGAARAESIDYGALADELNDLKSNGRIVAYLDDHLREHHRLQDLETAMMDGVNRLVEIQKLEANCRHRLGAMGADVVAQFGDRDSPANILLYEAGQDARRAKSELAALELERKTLTANIRDALVELVVRYREIKLATSR